MKTRFDFPFPTSWNADDLADAVPRPLSAWFDLDLSAATSTGPQAPARYARPRLPPARGALPALFQIR